MHNVFVVSILNWIGRGGFREKDLIISTSEKSSLLSERLVCEEGVWGEREGVGGCLCVCV